MLTERDVLRAIAASADLDTTPVRDYMTPNPIAVEPESPLDAACDLMISHGVRHLLVSERGTLVGVLNMRDVVGVLSGAATLGAVPGPGLLTALRRVAAPGLRPAPPGSPGRFRPARRGCAGG